MRTKSFLKKILALVQLGALLLIVMGGLVVLFPAPEGTEGAHLFCQGDHEKCGCDPELVAAKACCCYTRGPLAQKTASKPSSAARPSCCAAEGEKNQVETGIVEAPDRCGGEDGGEPALWIAVPTCGGGAKLFAAFSIKLDFSLAQSATLPRPAVSGIVPAIESKPWRSLSWEPSVPPPRFA